MLIGMDSGFVSAGRVVGISCIVEEWKIVEKKAQID
jgi:hypothetical protein